MLQVVIKGAAVAQSRPRVSKGNVYYPANVTRHKGLIQRATTEALIKANNRAFPLNMPISMEMVVYIEYPKRLSKKKQKMFECGEVSPTRRPDVDNYAKLVMDAMQGLAYSDDSHICRLVVTKEYAAEPSTVVRIYPMSTKTAQEAQ